MKIKHIQNNKEGFFKAISKDKEAGKLKYFYKNDHTLVIDHTEVNTEFSGQGIGKQLLFKVIEFARSKNLKILPLCSFAKTMFDKNSDINDVLS